MRYALLQTNHTHQNHGIGRLKLVLQISPWWNHGLEEPSGVGLALWNTARLQDASRFTIHEKSNRTGGLLAIGPSHECTHHVPACLHASLTPIISLAFGSFFGVPTR